jgi:hypothetical protein
LLELSEEPSVVLSMVMGSLGALEVAMPSSPPSEPFHPPASVVMSLNDEVNEVDALVAVVDP